MRDWGFGGGSSVGRQSLGIIITAQGEIFSLSLIDISLCVKSELLVFRKK